jgi:trehalose 6-phosphate synthase/phosphatase
MRRYARITPGSLVEPKDASVAFHLRGADPWLASVRVAALRRELTAQLGDQADLIDGQKVLEIRPQGVNKGCIVAEVCGEGAAAGTSVFATGDDRTDEDMFAALGNDALTIRVGPGQSRARFRVATPFELRRLLMRIARPVPQAGVAAQSATE